MKPTKIDWEKVQEECRPDLSDNDFALWEPFLDPQTVRYESICSEFVSYWHEHLSTNKSTDLDLVVTGFLSKLSLDRDKGYLNQAHKCIRILTSRMWKKRLITHRVFVPFSELELSQWKQDSRNAAENFKMEGRRVFEWGIGGMRVLHTLESATIYLIREPTKELRGFQCYELKEDQIRQIRQIGQFKTVRKGLSEGQILEFVHNLEVENGQWWMPVYWFEGKLRYFGLVPPWIHTPDELAEFEKGAGLESVFGKGEAKKLEDLADHKTDGERWDKLGAELRSLLSQNELGRGEQERLALAVNCFKECGRLVGEDPKAALFQALRMGAVLREVEELENWEGYRRLLGFMPGGRNRRKSDTIRPHIMDYLTDKGRLPTYYAFVGYLKDKGALRDCKDGYEILHQGKWTYWKQKSLENRLTEATRDLKKKSRIP